MWWGEVHVGFFACHIHPYSMCGYKTCGGQVATTARWRAVVAMVEARRVVVNRARPKKSKAWWGEHQGDGWGWEMKMVFMSCVFVYNKGLSLPKERYHIETRRKRSISAFPCPKESRSIIQAQAMPDGRGSEESTIFVAGLPDDMTNLEMHRWKNGRKEMSDTSYEKMLKMLLVMCEQTDWIWHFFYCCMEFFQRTDGQNLLSTWYECRITRMAGEHEGCRFTIPWLYPCLALFHVPTQPENHANQVSAFFSFWSYCTQRWERMRSTNVNMVDRSHGSAWIIISLDGFWSSDRVEESETSLLSR